MKVTKAEIVEYIVAFVGIVGVLAYIHATAEPKQVQAAQIAPIMMIDAAGMIRADTSPPAIRFREAAPVLARV